MNAPRLIPGRNIGERQVSPEGGNPKQLLPDDQGQQQDPNWSPDGSKIVLGGESGDVRSTIRVFDLASRQLTTLTDSQGTFSPRWSPDGRHIVALSSDSTRLLLFDFQTQKLTELNKGSMGWLNWSKDGQYVYVLITRARALWSGFESATIGYNKWST